MDLLITGLTTRAVHLWPGFYTSAATTAMTPFSNAVLFFRICPPEYQYCCSPFCCIINRHHKEVWETWYFWFGVVIIFLFILTSAFSYALGSCKRKQQNLIRIRNVCTPPTVPVISTISGPGGIIQPRILYKKPHPAANMQATAIISSSDMHVEDFASPLDPPYPAIQPVTIVRGSAPPQGYRQTTSYTELVLPPGYVDTEHYKRPL